MEIVANHDTSSASVYHEVDNIKRDDKNKKKI